MNRCRFSSLSAVGWLLLAPGTIHGNPSPEKTVITWQPVDHSVQPAVYHLSKLTLENRDQKPLENKGWKLYFSFVRRPLAALPEGDPLSRLGRDELARQGVKIAHADTAKSGDYFVLEPLPNFQPVAPGEKRGIEILVELWAILKSDQPSGFHMAFWEGEARAVMATIVMDPKDPKQTKVFDGDARPVQTAGIRYAENNALAPVPSVELADSLLPRPLKVSQGTGTLNIEAEDLTIQYPASLRREAEYLSAAMGDLLLRPVRMVAGQGKARANSVTLSVDPRLDVDQDGRADAEGYSLGVDARRGVSIVGTDPAGVFYGIQTLRQLVPIQVYKASAEGRKTGSLRLPSVSIQDAPLFSYRGMHLDVARHFQTKETVLKLLDRLAFFKINRFHFHLTDDEGWRLEIPGIPELTDYAGRRGFDPEESRMLHQGLGSSNDLGSGDGISGKAKDQIAANLGVPPRWQGFEQASANLVGKGWGHYSVQDFEEILAYATERHIKVIPEIDLPGHARAAVKAMEYRFRKYAATDPQEAWRYRLLDPEDRSLHTSVQGYTDNFVNPGMESTYAFIEKVVREIKARYDAVPGAELMAVHAGGDELPSLSGNVWWQGSPAVKQNPVTASMSDRELADYFFTRYHGILASAGTAMTGWSDVLTNGTGNLSLPGFMPMPWQNVWGWGGEQQAYQLANQGHQVILAHATNLYMDLAYNKDPDEPGYYWANFVDEKKTFEYRPFNIYANATENRWGGPFTPDPAWEKLTEAGKKNILGLEGLLWAENQKADELVDYAAFPKILGVAERAWNRNMAPEDQMGLAWSRFCHTLGTSILPRLDFHKVVETKRGAPQRPAQGEYGLNYRLPLPGGIIQDGFLKVNVRNAGLRIQYSTNDGRTWQTFTRPVRVGGDVLLRTLSASGRTSRVASVEMPAE